jgi:hypothetical protein
MTLNLKQQQRQQLPACLVVCLLLLQATRPVVTFNFDLNWPVIKTVSLANRKPPVDTYFGYSVAQHMVKTSKTP